MVELVGIQEFNDDDINVQVTTYNGFFVIQIASAILRGTLVVDEQTDREEITSLANGISDLLERVNTTRVDPDELPQ